MRPRKFCRRFELISLSLLSSSEVCLLFLPFILLHSFLLCLDLSWAPCSSGSFLSVSETKDQSTDKMPLPCLSMRAAPSHILTWLGIDPLQGIFLNGALIPGFYAHIILARTQFNRLLYGLLFAYIFDACSRYSRFSDGCLTTSRHSLDSMLLPLTRCLILCLPSS